MSALKPFETEVLRLLVGSVLAPGQLATILSSPDDLRYEYTGSGYLLTLRHASLPVARTACSAPVIRGTVGDVHCGFVAFLGGGELTLECHSWGAIDVPDGFRESDVVLEARETPAAGRLPLS